MLDKQPSGAHPVIDLRHGHARPQKQSRLTTPCAPVPNRPITCSTVLT
jgi:hypothetical protein